MLNKTVYWISVLLSGGLFLLMLYLVTMVLVS